MSTGVEYSLGPWGGSFAITDAAPDMVCPCGGLQDPLRAQCVEKKDLVIIIL
jgi:hypothetical protein